MLETLKKRLPFIFPKSYCAVCSKEIPLLTEDRIVIARSKFAGKYRYKPHAVCSQNCRYEFLIEEADKHEILTGDYLGGLRPPTV